MFIQLKMVKMGKYCWARTVTRCYFTGSDEVALGLMDFMTAHQIIFLTKSPLWDMITTHF